MTFEQRMTEFAGLPVAAFPQDLHFELKRRGLTAEDVAWRIGVDVAWERYGAGTAASLDELFDRFLHRIDSARVRALIFGPNSVEEQDLSEAVDLLTTHAARFPALRAVFLGDILREESEVSWIYGARLAPVLAAFPALEILGARGDFALAETAGPDRLAPRFEPVRHENLRSLTLETGGLPSGILGGVLASDLPNLEHLELYLGAPHYGGDAGVADLAGLLAGGLFPNLRSLGLKDSVLQDEIAAALADAPLLARLEALDLSLGVLGDTGAAALLAGQSLAHLRKLDLRHHYLGDQSMARLRAALPGVQLDLSEQQQDERTARGHSGRYIAVSE
ncbi:MAG TPA: STM4015 family protein [Actinocrinis sp.]|nr:STM4015 family protein [Actinocrinis sp.]